jgi:hypothetical protein
MTRVLYRTCEDCDEAEPATPAAFTTRCLHGRRLRVTVRLERPRTR